MTAVVDLIQRKKRGEEHTREELDWLVKGFSSGGIPDYQMAAWLMAVCWRGMTPAEVVSLTQALVATGQTLAWPEDRPVVDKHSTGGVGDKTSLALVPLVASAGIVFVKMSGRGLGYTGGTLDKLESIPGFRVNLSLEELRRQVERIGCALVGQSPELVPGDAAVYALRDVTGTVDSLPLVASSVMAKKLAAGASGIVLDVKYGSGALMPDIVTARQLAELMISIGEAAGRRIRALLSNMDEPLGEAVGNALEVKEAISVLAGDGPEDLRKLTVDLGAHLMVLGRATSSLDDARGALQRLLESGVAADHFERLIAAQGGDARVVREPNRLPAAPLLSVVHAEREGYVERVDARGVADAALALGAGRRKKGDSIEPGTGVRRLVRRGEYVRSGQPLAEIHAAAEGAAGEARAILRKAIPIVDREVVPVPWAIEVLGS